MGICLDIQNNRKIRGIVVVHAYPGCLCFFSCYILYGSLEIRHGIFGGLAFGPGNFLGFV